MVKFLLKKIGPEQHKRVSIQGAANFRFPFKFDLIIAPFRFYFRYELEHLIKRSKLTLEKIWGDFEEGDLTGDSKEFIVVCRK